MADTVVPPICGCGAKDGGLFCKDCECFICPDCLVDKHKKHDFAKINDVAKSKRTQLNEIVAEGKGSLVSLLQTNLAFIQENIDLEVKNYDIVFGQICNRASFLEKEMASLKESYSQQLREFSTGRKDYLHGFQTLLSEVLEGVLEYPAADDSDQNEDKNVRVITLEMKLQRALSMVAQVSKWPTSPCVELTYPDSDQSPGEEFSALKTLFGTIKQIHHTMKENVPTETLNSNGSSFSDSIKETQDTCVSVLEVEGAICIDEMFPVSFSNEVFVKSGKSFYRTNTNKCTLFMSDVKDVTMATDGTVLVIKNDDTCIHQVCPNGVSRVFANMCPCQPHHVFISKSGNVQVVIQEVGHHPVILAEFNKYGIKVSDVHVEDIDLSFVRFRKDMFGHLYYIKMSYFPLMESVHVLKENKYDHENYHITGIFGYDPSAACRPIDACFDDEDRLIIVDHKNNSVYLQDKEGRLELMLVAPQQHLLSSPRSVLFVRDQLWVACDDRKIYIFNYKQLVTDSQKEVEGFI